MKILTRFRLLEINRLLVFTTLAAVMSASGATFNVNSQADTVDAAPGNAICADSGGHCTLRAAVMEANATAILDNINVPAKTHVLTLGQLTIASNMNIKGANKTTSIVEAQGQSRIFRVSSGKTVQISTITVRTGRVNNDDGGCIRNAGQLTLNTVVVTGCRATGDDEFDHFGGGIANFGQLTIQGSQVTRNTLDNPCTNCGAGGGGLSNHAGARLTIIRTTVDANSGNLGTWTFGGGVYSEGNLDVTESTFTRNVGHGADGVGTGGIYNRNGSARIVKSTVSNNTAEGGIGGIANHGILTLINCTITGNKGGGFPGFSRGAGAIDNSGTLRVLSSTIAGNRGDTDATGGIGSGCSASFLSSSSQTSSCGGTAFIKNSIIAGNTSTSSPDCDSLTSLTYSLIGNTGGCTIPAGVGNLLNLNPMLGPLANNGGPTQTRALLAGSIALDSASPAPVGTGGNSCENTDQRGVARPQNGRCDMGAYERRTGIPHFSEDQEADGDQP